jgi:hypothetical protein
MKAVVFYESADDLAEKAPLYAGSHRARDLRPELSAASRSTGLHARGEHPCVTCTCLVTMSE